MKIALLITQYQEVKSGPGRFCEYLRQINGRNGLEFIFFSQQISQSAGNEIRVPIPDWAQRIPFSSYLRGWWFRRTVTEHLRHEDIDFILAADYSMAMFLPAQLRQQTAVMVNDDNFLLIYSPERKLGKVGLRGLLSRKLSYFFERNSVRTCGLTVANSLHTAGLIGRIYQVPPERVFLLYKAVDLGTFRFRQRAAGGPVGRILFVKNDWRRGGLDLILEALGGLPEGGGLTLALAGIAKPEEALVKEIAARCAFRGNLEFLGMLGREALLTELDRADLFLNFSRQEALGVSCLEAMAAGVPVVASDAGGLKEVLDGGKAGVQIPAGNAEALRNSLRHILHHPEELEPARLYAREHAARFSLENLEANLQLLFRRLGENQAKGM